MKYQGLKISAFAMLAILLASNAYASANTFNQGFYAGGSLGAGWGQASWDGITDIYAVNDQGSPLSYAARWTPDGDTMDTVFAGRALGGYQFVFNPLYLAFELGWTFSEENRFDRNEEKDFFNIYFLSTIYATADSNNSVTLGENELNIDMKLGGLIRSNILTYARVGYALNRMTVESNAIWMTVNTDPLGGFPAPFTIAAHGSSRESDIANGIRLGLGAEFLATKHLGVTFDYIYTYYGKITTASAGAASTALSGPPQYYNIGGTDAPVVAVSTQVALLGLTYHW